MHLKISVTQNFSDTTLEFLIININKFQRTVQGIIKTLM